ITEIQGNELLTLQRTAMVVRRMQLDAQLQMVNLLGMMAGIAAPPPTASAAVAAQAQAPVIVGGVVVHAAIAVTEDVDVDELVDRVGTDLAIVIDRKLDELRTRESRAIGDTGRTE
ncbi:hypothetical protein LCGC14_0930110, partial [marine sediment metagenome]